MAADLPLPKTVLGHGWVLIGDSKMSKSVGNVIDPLILCEKYGPDAIRYFLMKEMGYGLDCNYSEEAMALRINTDLANDYGNLLSRATGMINKFQDGVVLKPLAVTEYDDDLIALAKATPERFAKLMDHMEWSNALTELWKLVNKANKYIDDAAPWALNKAGQKDQLATVLYNMCEVVRLVTIMVSPVMPGLPARVWAQLGISDKPELHTWDSLGWGNFPMGIKIDRGDPLFPRIDLAALAESIATVSETATVEEEPIDPIGTECTIEDFQHLDLRVVKVVACEKVPKTDKLLKFTLQLGQEERTVLSGIAKYYQPEQLVGKNLVLIANLKPVTIRGIESKGMLLSACGKDRLQLVELPDMPSGVKVM
ncbi:MAG: methionine--tRNA ligase subunit beta, partial [Clostridiales bacterium]